MRPSARGGSVILIIAATLAAHAAQATTSPAKATGQPPFNPADSRVRANESKIAALPPPRPDTSRHPAEDASFRRQAGQASVYPRTFEGRRMADQRRFHSNANQAASKTLPIGTLAKVTNLKTGRTATVTIEDRGPFVAGRVVDVSQATARQLGITKKEGVAPVVVAPIAVPPPNGLRPEAGAAAPR